MNIRNLLFAAVCIGTAMTAAASGTDPVEAYFLNYLEGDRARFNSDKTVKQSQVAETSQQVWEA